jgi:integrase
LNGAKPAWLQQQLGHSSLKLTLDAYAKWLRERDLAAADRQDARSNLVVTNAVTTAGSEG